MFIPHVNSGEFCYHWVSPTFFLPETQSKESSIHQVEVLVLDVDRTLPDLPGGEVLTGSVTWASRGCQATPCWVG